MNHKPGSRWWDKGALLALFVLLFPVMGHCSEQDQRRILIGLKLFPAVLAADAALATKATPDGNLPLLLLYRNDRTAAEHLAVRLKALDGVRGLRFAPIVAPYSALQDYTSTPLAGVFLTEHARDALAQVIQFGRARRIITFSPFEDDVERGILCGLYVSDRILPYLNMEALHSSGVELKPFFIEVARHYE